MKALCVCALAIAACSAGADQTSSNAATTAATVGAGGAGGSGGGAGGGVCDDSGPDPRNHTAGTCENLGETSLVAYCHTAIDELKPGVAYAAISCLANVCIEAGCTTEEYRSQAEQCLIDALANACADDSANMICMELEMLCAGADCHALVDGMSNATRAETLACAQTDCSQGLIACAEQVLSP